MTRYSTIIAHIFPLSLAPVAFLAAALLVSVEASAFFTDCSTSAHNTQAPECVAGHLDSANLTPLSEAFPDALSDSLSGYVSGLGLQAATDGPSTLARQSPLLQLDPQASGFHVNQTLGDEGAPESAPLLLLLGALLTVVLVRAKSFNNK